MAKLSYKSPGIYENEYDKTSYTYEQDIATNKRVGLTGFAKNGPLNTIVKVSSLDDFIDTFGEPLGYSGLAATLVLQNSQPLYFVRSNVGGEARKVNIKGSLDGTEIEDIITLTNEYIGSMYNKDLKVKITQSSANEDITFSIIKGTEDIEEEQTISIDDIRNNVVTKIGTFVIIHKLGTSGDVLMTNDTFTFSTGADGDITSEDSRSKVISNLDLFSDVESADIDILCCCYDYGSDKIDEYINKVNSITLSRNDCIALIDTPYEDTIDEIVGDKCHIKSIDNSQLACYHNWGSIYNSYTSTNEFCPESVAVLYGLAKEYKSYDLWEAPAGYPRMDLSIVSELHNNLNLSDRDKLYDCRINPICNYKQLGISAWGQKTLLKSDSMALNRLNVRLLLNYIKKAAEKKAVNFLFTNISDQMVSNIKQTFSKIMEPMKNNGGIYDYRVDVENTEELRTQNAIRVILQVKPFRSAEFILVDVVLKNQDADFD